MPASIYQYENLVDIIFKINKLHYSFSSELETLLYFNLKKSVSSVVIDNTIDRKFQELIASYKAELNKNIFRISEIQSKFIGIRYRIKQAESISEKIIYYMGEAHEFGKIPLNKCLNDFLGFRIIVNDLDSIYAILKSDDRISDVKTYFRKDGDYRGIHLYFKNGNNKFFPWELQIWDEAHSLSNEISHKEHKQKRKYISLPQYYFNANLEKEE